MMCEQKISCEGCGSKWVFVGVGNYIIDAGTCDEQTDIEVSSGVFALDRTDYLIIDAISSGTRDGYRIYIRK